MRAVLPNSKPRADDLRDRLNKRLFDRPIVQNNFRGELIEEIVSSELGDSWKHCAGDWHAWDFERILESGIVRLQIKQSAARQSWDKDGDQIIKSRVGKFPIGFKTGYFIEDKWISESGRHTEIYLLCYHDDRTELADHFDVARWDFYILRASEIAPKEKPTISIPELEIMVSQDRVSKAKSAHLREILELAASNVVAWTIPPSH